MPRWIASVLVLLATASLIPFACVFRARHSESPVPRVHLLQDMDNQPKYRAQRANPLFADGRAARPPVAGTVPRSGFVEDESVATGRRDGVWIETFPIAIDASTLGRGRERFDIYCAPCHGLSGHGDGIVAVRADRLQEGTWVPPSSLHDAAVVERPVGHLFNTISHGIRTMPAYGPQIPVADRWAIVSYVRALQKSQRAPVALLGESERATLREVRP